tara:strand:- start:228 stop:2714 length:2487 start_codon:yes stop_codon:yes gene_type:complete
MGTTRINQTSFHSGELDPQLVSRNDLKAYGRGLQKARNVIIRNQGAVERRPGTFFRVDLGATSRLESFVFSGSQEYIFAFQNTALKIYSTAGVLLQTITSQPWTSSNFYELNVSQQGDTMIITHGSFMPIVITRTGATSFVSSVFAFDTSVNGEKVYQPYFKFADDTITLDINSVTKGATDVALVTSADYWTTAHVGTRVRYMGAELLITARTNATTAVGTLKEVPIMELDEDPFASSAGSAVVVVTHVAHGFSTGASVTIAGAESMNDVDGAGIAYSALNGARTITTVDDNHYSFTTGGSDAATESFDGGGVRVTVSGHPPTRNWDEQVFSAVNGFPNAVAFHQQRLFFGGIDNLPDGIQSSKVGLFYNFDVGKGDDNESVQIQIASDEINEIRHLISGKVLEVLTNTSEFYLKASIGKPITPADIEMVRQSTYGSQQKTMPRQYDGGTIYIQNNGKTVREYVYNSATEEFASAPIAMMSSHLVNGAVDSATINSLSDRDEQFYFITNSDGTLAVYSSQRLQEVAGWMQWNTVSGSFESVACTTGFVYVSVKRTINSATVYYLEQLATTSFDIPTDMTVTKTLSGSYQPHGSPLTNGTTSSSTNVIVNGMTSAPQVGETFTFAGNATVYTVNAVSATSNSNEYSITVNAAKSTANDVALTFLTSRTWSALNSAPDMRGLTAHGTSGSTEGATNINYYGSGVVNSSGVVVFDSPTSAIDIGLNYVIEITTMPADGLIGSSSSASPLTAHPRKIAKAIFNLSNSYNIKVNEMDVLINEISDLDTSAGLTSFTGQKEVHFLGYDTNPTMDITQSVPLPIRILTITTEIYY